MNAKLKKAVELLDRVQTFDGHTQLYAWYEDPKTQELMDEIRAFIKEAIENEASNL